MERRISLRDRVLIFGIPCACFALLAFLTLHYVIAVPMIDQWDFVPALLKSYQGQLTFGDLWAQHNEHRLVFPRLIMLALAHMSDWDLRWELTTSLLFAVAILGVIGYQIRQTRQALQDNTLIWLFPVIGIIVFSLRQSQNWMWGWQLQIFLNILAVVAGIALLTHPTRTWPRLMAAILCAIVATYSFANGLLFWLVGGFLLLISPRDKAFQLRFAAWSVCAVLTMASYFYHYAKPSDSPPLLAVLQHPGAAVAYFLSYIGAFISLKDTPLIGVPMGIIGLALFSLALRRLRASGQIPLAVVAPYLAYALYALLSALVSTVGRAGFGAKQAMSSRYLTISELFWIATLTLGYLAIRQGEATLKTAQWGKGSKQVLVAAGLVLAINSLKGIGVFSQQYHAIKPVEAQMLLLNYGAGSGLSLVPNRVQERAPFLKEHHLNIYREH